MVYQATRLDDVFRALANHHRRDILMRVSKQEQTASRLAKAYGITLAAVAKHFGVLERAGMILTEKRGKERFARIQPHGLQEASQFLAYYESYWNTQLDQLEEHLKETDEHTN